MNWHMTVCGLRDLQVGMANTKLRGEISNAIAFGTRYLKQKTPVQKNEDIDWDAHTNALCTWRPECVLDVFVLLDKNTTTPIVGVSMYDPQVSLLQIWCSKRAHARRARTDTNT